jgi:hypothetical protein
MQDDKTKLWWALRFAPGICGFVVDSTLLMRHWHTVQPTAYVQQTFSVVASKGACTMQDVRDVIDRMAKGGNIHSINPCIRERFVFVSLSVYVSRSAASDRCH